MGQIVSTTAGLYCPEGDFYVDPWGPVERAVITHGHGDHARTGSRHYLAVADGVGLLRARLGPEADVRGFEYGERVTLNGVTVSLHPAGHVLGSAQVRIEHQGHVTVVSGDYKRHADPTCRPFEPLRCHFFMTESTFGLPVYRWPEPTAVLAEMNAWWRENQEAARTSIVLAYSLGKAQRILAGMDASIGPILAHGAVFNLVEVYRASGVALPPVLHADPDTIRLHKGRALVLAPPSANGSPWIRRFRPFSSAIASGWMRIRGQRRRRAVDRGFVLSDHVDWDALNETIDETGAETVAVTHGYTDTMVRWLRDRGRDAFAIETHFVGEAAEDVEGQVASHDTVAAEHQ